MQEKRVADYRLWVQLANDPSQTEEARQYYLLRMEGVVHAQMRDAFRLAVGAVAAAEDAPNIG